MNMSEEYYVHRKGTFVGNAPSFWAKGGNGYTGYVLGAERFSKEEAEKLFKSDKNKWEIFKCDDVDKRLHLVFDYQDKKRLGTDEPCAWNSGYAPDVKDLQQKLLQSQASEARLRETLEDTKSYIDPDYVGILELIDKALSAPANTAELEAYVESEIEKRFEKVGEVGIDSSYEELPNFTDLYAKKG
jgi:hypothetical protein